MTGNAPESRMWRLLDVSTAERAATHYVTIYISTSRRTAVLHDVIPPPQISRTD